MFNPANLMGRGLRAPGGVFNPELTEEQRLIESNKQALNRAMTPGGTAFFNPAPEHEEPLNEIDAFGRTLSAQGNFRDKFQAFTQALEGMGGQQPHQQQRFGRTYEPLQQHYQPEDQQPQEQMMQEFGQSGFGGGGMFNPNWEGNAGSILANATKYTGVRYKWGGTDPRTGLDCSGFTQRVALDSGEDITRTTATQMQYFRSQNRFHTDLSRARPGDMLYFGSSASPSGRHTGIYVGGGRMIHAGSNGVAIANIGNRQLLGVGMM